MADLYTIITEEEESQDPDFTTDDTLTYILGKISEEISED